MYLISGKYTAPYTDISTNCHISGNSTAFFQDGTLYFSGWIDSSCTNPSGFVDNNLMVRIVQDRSVTYDIPDQTYTFGTPTISSSLYTSFSGNPIADSYQDSTLYFTHTTNPSGFYDCIDESIFTPNVRYIEIVIKLFRVIILISFSDITFWQPFRPPDLPHIKIL